MLPFEFPKKWSIILTSLLLLFLGSTVLLTRKLSPQTTDSSLALRSSPVVVIPSPTMVLSKMNPDFKILYQAPDDKEGRTIIYESLSNQALYNGVGVLKFPTGGRPYMIGIFESWRAISDTKDRILILEDPLSQKTLDPIYVAFSPSLFFNTKVKTTRLTVENINKTVNASSQEDPIDPNFMVEITKVDSQELQDLIRKGDALVIIPLAIITGSSWTTIKDNRGMVFATQIILRRMNGAGDISI